MKSTCSEQSVPYWPSKQAQVPVEKSQMPWLAQSTWHRLPNSPTVRLTVTPRPSLTLAGTLQSVSFAEVRGLSADGQRPAVRVVGGLHD